MNLLLSFILNLYLSLIDFLYTPARKLFIGRIPRWFSEQDLKDELGSCGFTFEKVSIKREEDNRNKGDGDYSLPS